MNVRNGDTNAISNNAESDSNGDIPAVAHIHKKMIFHAPDVKKTVLTDKDFIESFSLVPVGEISSVNTESETENNENHERRLQTYNYNAYRYTCSGSTSSNQDSTSSSKTYF